MARVTHGTHHALTSPLHEVLDLALHDTPAHHSLDLPEEVFRLLRMLYIVICVCVCVFVCVSCRRLIEVLIEVLCSYLC